MGLFQKIFGSSTPKAVASAPFFQLLNGYTPAFTTFGGQLYEEGLVKSVITTTADHCSKLRVQFTGTANAKLVNRLKIQPNPWTTWDKFLSRLYTVWELDNNAFIVPVRNDQGDKIGIAIVLPSLCELREMNGEIWVRYEFSSGNFGAVALAECALMTRRQYKNDMFGGTNDALNATMDLATIQRQGIEEAIKSGVSFRFIAESRNNYTDEDLQKERKRFNETNLQNAEGGFLVVPYKFVNVKQIDSKPYTVDPKQQEQIRTNVFDYFGSNEDVVQNKAYGDKWVAFYEGKIEVFAVAFASALESMLYTPREISAGNTITCTANRLQYLATSEKINMTEMAADRGLMTIDEIRDIWQLAPLPDGLGQKIPIRGEYYDLRGERNADTD